MNGDNLDPEEQQLLDEYERGEWVSDFSPERRNQLRAAGLDTATLDQRISIDISSHDLDILQRYASEKGVPFELLASTILHKYVSGGLVDVSQDESQT